LNYEDMFTQGNYTIR